MNELKLKIKLDFITGLKKVVLKELSQFTDFHIVQEEGDSIYLDFTQNIAQVSELRSVLRAYIVVQNLTYTPRYISRHKSILDNLLSIVTKDKDREFKTFKIICAGSGSPEVRSIAKYIQKTYGLIEKINADVKIYIIKLNIVWEIGVQITPRPLSLRDYKARNMIGAMNPTIAYAINSLCELENANSYLNIFSGSATLLIEAGQCYQHLKQLVGFDNNKKNISSAIQNIKKAGLIKRIELKEKDIFNNPDVGKFDVITSDLPFGMSISKNEDLESLYRYFIEYCQRILNDGGKLVIYTSKHEILKRIILESKFKIIKRLELKIVTSVGAYLRPKIFVCKLK